MKFFSVMAVCSFAFTVLAMASMLILPAAVQPVAGTAAIVSLCWAIVCGTVLIVKEIVA